MDSVTTDTHPTRSYRVVPTKNTSDAVSVYNSILADMMEAEKALIGNSSEAAAGVEEDILEKCWKAPPQKSTTSPQDDAAWATLVDRTAALEKAAENLAISEKKLKRRVSGCVLKLHSSTLQIF
eukprot:1064147-Ditylum_brightwellii.AAC.1